MQAKYGVLCGLTCCRLVSWATANCRLLVVCVMWAGPAGPLNVTIALLCQRWLRLLQNPGWWCGLFGKTMARNM